MRLVTLILMYGVLLQGSFGSDGPQPRFSESTAAAIQKARDGRMVLLSERPPRTEVDPENEQRSMEGVLKWLDEQIQNGKPISNVAFGQLADLLLDPANHHPGLYAVGDPARYAIRFTSDGKDGYITFGYSLVVVYWDSRREGVLLNDSGSKTLEEWKE